MTLPETDLARIRRWIDARNDRRPERVVGQIRYEMDVDARSVTILECRSPWREDFGPEWTRFPGAKLRYKWARRQGPRTGVTNPIIARCSHLVGRDAVQGQRGLGLIRV